MIQQQIVINPGFEIQNQLDGSDPAAWVQDPSHIAMTNAAGVPYSGNWCVRLSGRNSTDNLTDYVYQTLDVPEYAIASLFFYLSIVQDPLAPDDPLAPSCTLTLKVQNTSGVDLKVLSTWDVTHTSTGTGWQQEGSFDLSEFANQLVRLTFTATQTDHTKNAIFYIDEVRTNVILNLPISSFPPLISDKSRDLQDQIQQYGNRVYCSRLIHSDPNDQFFNPTWGDGADLTGFAANGSYYTAGVEDQNTKAAWWLEAYGGGDAVTRSGTQAFPATALVLVTDESISILDQTDNLSMWMIFKKKPSNAYSDTFNLDPGASFVPVNVDYDSGVIYVTFEPTAGSTITSTVVLCIDFVQDFIYLDSSL